MIIKKMARELLYELRKETGLEIPKNTEGRIEKKMLKLFERSHRVRRSNRLSVMLPEFDIVFKPSAISQIKSIKGWKSDAEMSRELGLSKAYICGLKKQKFGVTSTVITRVAGATGNTDKNWHIFYDLKFMGFKMSSDPKFNAAKHKGEMPYNWASKSAAMRKEDYVEEVEQQIPPYLKNA